MSPRDGQPSLGRLLGVIGCEAALFGILWGAAFVLGSVPLGHVQAWAQVESPVAVATAVLRLLGLVLTAWMLLGSVLFGVSLLFKGPLWRRRFRLLTIAPVRRFLEMGAAASIVISASSAVGAAAHAEGAPALIQPLARSGADAGDAVPAAQPDNVHISHPGEIDHNQPLPAAAAPSPVLDGLPAGSHYYVVQSGDCLSVLAERHLGDWRRDVEIVALNRRRPQSDGRSLVDDHWIYPGWVLLMPPDAVGVSKVGLSNSPGAEDLTVPTFSGAAPNSGFAERVGGQPDAVPPVRTERASEPAPGQVVPAARGGPAGPMASSSKPGEERTADLAMAAVAAGGFIWALSRRRKEGMHSRSTGSVVGRNTPAVERADASARALGEEELVRRVDLLLRHVYRHLAEHPAEQPGEVVSAVVMARVWPEGIELLMDPPSLTPPAHMEALEAGYLWVLDNSLSLLDLDLLAGESFPPAPTLVSLGSSEGGEVLLNLEHAGWLAVEGEGSSALLEQLRLGLKTLPWAVEGLAELTVLDAAAGDEAQARKVEELARRALRNRTDLAGAASIYSERVHSGEYQPVVVLLRGDHHAASVLERLSGAAVPDSSGLAVVGPPDPTAWRVRVDTGGAAVLAGRIGSRQFEMNFTVALDGEGVEWLEDALEHPLGFVGQATIEEPPEEPALAVVEDSDPVRELGDEDQVTQSAAEKSLAGLVAEEAPGRDVADPESRVRIRLLGPPEVVNGPEAPGVPSNRMASALALVSYLALKGRPVTADELAAALWPVDENRDNLGEPRRKTVMNVISRARGLLGEDADGAPHLRLGPRGYFIGPGVDTDWSRFRQLASAGPEDPELLDRLEEAVGLVAGEPFAGCLGSPFFEWVSAQHLDLAMLAEIVDTMEKLALAALERGEPQLAERMVRRGLELDPAREELYQVWMHIAGSGRRPDQVDEIYRRLCRAIQRHIDPSLSPKDASRAIWQRYVRVPAARR